MRIRNGFEEYFCLRSNLISAKRNAGSENGYGIQSSAGLKTGVEDDIFFGLKQGEEFGEPGGTPPPRIPRSTPPPRIFKFRGDYFG